VLVSAYWLFVMPVNIQAMKFVSQEDRNVLQVCPPESVLTRSGTSMRCVSSKAGQACLPCLSRS
jgi:hypothetical protein